MFVVELHFYSARATQTLLFLSLPIDRQIDNSSAPPCTDTCRRDSSRFPGRRITLIFRGRISINMACSEQTISFSHSNYFFFYFNFYILPVLLAPYWRDAILEGRKWESFEHVCKDWDIDIKYARLSQASRLEGLAFHGVVPFCSGSFFWLSFRFLEASDEFEF